jgi:hypothetical protein
MTGTDTSARRAATSFALVAGMLFLIALALRGHLPGATSQERERTPDDPVSAGVVIALLLVAVGVVVVAVVARARNRAAGPTPAASRSVWMRSDRTRTPWRMMLIAFGLIVGWLLLVVYLSGLMPGVAVDPPRPDSSVQTTQAAPDTMSPPVDTPPAPEEPTALPSRLLGYFYAATVVFLAVLVVGSIVAGRRRGSPPDALEAAPDGVTAASAPSESLARAAEVGLAEVGDMNVNPRTAIIACYAAMERELANVPGAIPQDFDTASEVLERAVERNALRPDSATELVDLFDEARFSPHVMTEAHRQAAVGVLRRVLHELGSLT